MTASTKKNQKTRWINILAALFVLVVGLVSLYLGWQKYQLNQTQQQLLAAIETQKQTLIELKKREQIGEKMQAVTIHKKAQAYRKDWSVVVEDLNKAIVERSGLKFQSVAVSSEGIVTVQGTAPHMLAAASLILMIDRNDRFANAFISHINTLNSETKSGVSFSATFDYLPLQP